MSLRQFEAELHNLLQPNIQFLHILREGGALKDKLTRTEVLKYLKQYIAQKLLYDKDDPQTINCSHDQLGHVFGVRSFTISDVMGLIARNTVSTQSEYKNNKENLNNQKTREAAEKIGQKRKRKHSDSRESSVSASSGSGKKNLKKAASLSFCLTDDDGEGLPWYFKVQKSDVDVLSLQDCETALVQDTDNDEDIWYVGSDVDAATTLSTLQLDDDHFSVEYEIESSENDSDSVKSSSECSSDEEAIVEAHVFISEKPEDEFYLADYSASESDSSDPELSEDDKWKCRECKTVNKPGIRYCGRCWKLRQDWLPNMHHRRIKRNIRYRRSVSAPAAVSSSEETASSSFSKVAIDTTDVQSSESMSCALIGERTRSSGFVKDREGSYEVKSNSGVSEAVKSVLGDIVSECESISTPTHKTVVPNLYGKTSKIASQTFSGESLQDIIMASASSSQESGISAPVVAQSVGNLQQQADSQGTNQNADIPILSSSQDSGIAMPGTSQEGRRSRRQRQCSTQSYTNVPQPVTGCVTCLICTTRPKDASIIHGHTGHQVSCYKCAKKLRRRGRPCPVCRRPIQKIIKNFFV